MPNHQQTLRRGRPFVMLAMTLIALFLASLPASAPVASALQHSLKVNSQSYKEKNGFWAVLDMPEEFRTNTIHAAALPTGKILLVAGSGNNRANFNAYNDDGNISVLATVIFD